MIEIIVINIVINIKVRHHADDSADYADMYGGGHRDTPIRPRLQKPGEDLCRDRYGAGSW